MKTQPHTPERPGHPVAAVHQPPLLLEREHELQTLEGAVAAAAGRAGQIVVVEGAPGLGKTQLLADAAAAARRSGQLVLEGRGAELEQGFAFGVARQLLEPAMLGLPDDERAELFAGAAGLAARLFDQSPD